MRYRLLILVIVFLSSSGFAKKKKPEIIGQKPLTTTQGQPIAIALTDLTVLESGDGDEDEAPPYPQGYTLEVFNGNGYTVSGTTVTPDGNFTGTLYVPVRVDNGEHQSKKYDLIIEVTVGTQVAPVITGQVPLSTPENSPLTIQLSHLSVTDPDNTFPVGYTLAVFPGTNYSVTEATVTPNAGFSGVLVVPVTVNDGLESSAPFNLEITVSAVNDPPVITGQNSLSTSENTALTIQLADLIVTDPDNTYPDGFSLAVSPGSNYTVAGTTITPAPGFSGPLSVPVTVSDGTNTSNTFALAVTVTAAANIPPVITGHVALSTNENAPVVLQLAHLTVTDPDDPYPAGFALTVYPGTNYTVDGTTVTPLNGFSGTLSVSVTVNDGTDNSAPFTVSITVNPLVNVPPVITGQDALSTAVNTPITLQLSHLTVADPDNAYPTGFTLNVSAGTNYTVSGTTVTPAANYAGTLTVPVTVSDGTDTSSPFSLTITVIPPANTPPVITGQTSLSTSANTPLTLSLSNLTVTDPDDTYPAGFTLNISPGTNYTVAGTTITPAAGFSGTLQIPVTVNDGTDTSAPFSVAVNVTPPINVPPQITGQTALSILENESLLLELAHLTVTDPDNVYPAGFRLSVRPGTNYTVAGDVITPAPNFTGILTIPVTVNDGTNESAPFNLRVTVIENNINVPPVITGQAGLSTFKNERVAILLSHLVVSDPDDAYPAGFTLKVLPGANYTFTGTQVIPVANFVGSLSVNVTVNDGSSVSPVFPFRIDVIDKGELQILAQRPLEVREDSSVTIRLNDLIVNDSQSRYPTGFTLTASPGENYTVSGQTIVPAKDFHGNLTVGVTVSNGTTSSNPFSLLIVVTPVNDAPVIASWDNTPLLYASGRGPLVLAENAVVTDVDSEYLLLAEISFRPESYQADHDELLYENTGNIRGIYDGQSGILSLIGHATTAEYTSAIQSIRYNFNTAGDTAFTAAGKGILVTLNDGQSVSAVYEKRIELAERIGLEIPNAFTPNNDAANDTWQIKVVDGENGGFENALVRVYDKRGLLVFQAAGLDGAWDGRFNGEILPADVYYYTIDLNLPYADTSYRGAVAILR
ncbi:MAG TPA: tandem-95 repeat protein [Ohtaekwangia sp.]|nr:tandem-95 repeat protein [Ohtaekwangia sp.]